MQEATIADRVARMRNDAAMREAWEIAEDASLIERQQQVIDLLMKAVEPFETYLKEKGRQEWMYDVDDIAPALESEFGENVRLTMGDLRRAREAKVEAERILSPREKTND